MNKVLLVEDNFLNRRLFQKCLEENNYQVFGVKSVIEAKELLSKNTFVAAILDIHLGENQPDGISLGRYINEEFELPVIYLTAYEDSKIVSDAIETNPYAYLTKPFKEVDLISTVYLAIKSAHKEVTKTVRVGDGVYNIDLPIDEILYIESDKNYLLFHTHSGVYKLRSTIKLILEELAENGFLRVHRAYVVNKEKIEKYSNKGLVVNGFEIPMTKSYEHLKESGS